MLKINLFFIENETLCCSFDLSCPILEKDICCVCVRAHTFTHTYVQTETQYFLNDSCILKFVFEFKLHNPDVNMGMTTKYMNT